MSFTLNVVKESIAEGEANGRAISQGKNALPSRLSALCSGNESHQWRRDDP